MKNLIATIKKWNIENFGNLKERDGSNEWHLIDKKEQLTPENVEAINPRYIFVPHWSWIIPKEIWKNYETVIFHTADLPYGRGGSPLPNQILRGIYNSKVCALKAIQEIDAGPIYLKEDIDLSLGNIEELLRNISGIIFEKMIPKIIKGINPIPQMGNVTNFKRRVPENSNLLTFLLENPNVNDRGLYDFIRIVDGEGYPRAYIPLNERRIEYTDAKLDEGRFSARTQLVKNKNE